jgi:hypothetical protein
MVDIGSGLAEGSGLSMKKRCQGRQEIAGFA